MAELITDLQHVARNSNFVVDALSREGAAATKVVSDQVDFYPDWTTIAAASVSVSDVHWLAAPQAKDQELQQFLHRNTKCKMEQISRGDSSAV